MSDALVKVSSSIDTSGWTRERIDLVKRAICPKGITDDEFALFIEQCKRSGLDPMLKEIYCVPRKKKVGDKDNPKWITVHEAQPSEAGMLTRAEKFPGFLGITAAAVFASDKISINAGAQSVEHTFSPVGNRGRLIGAWARLTREGKEPILVWLEADGYRQQSPLWDKIPATMIEKCARVAVLRKAYPGPFGGLYIREEMPAEEFPAQAATVAPPKPASNVRQLITSSSARELQTIPDTAPVDAELVPFDPPPPDDVPTVNAPPVNTEPSPVDKAVALITEAPTLDALAGLTQQILALNVAKDPAVRTAYDKRRNALKAGAA